MIDTHAHLANADLAENIEHYLQLATEAGVDGILCVATSAKDSTRCIELAQRFPMIRASVGIHPNYCHQASESDWKQVAELAENSSVVALGETGLDRYWEDCPWAMQVEYLSRHIELARKRQLPIIVHIRDCMDEAIDILLREYAIGPFHAVMHSFTGSINAANRCIEAGFYISFAGMVTFKNAAEIQESAARICKDRLLIETDCPYLTPHPFRGKRPNHPAMVKHTAEYIAKLRGITLNELEQITSANAKRLFANWR